MNKLTKYNKKNYPNISANVYEVFKIHKNGICTMYQNDLNLIKAKFCVILGILYNLKKTNCEDPIFSVLDCKTISLPLEKIKFDYFQDIDANISKEELFNKEFIFSHLNKKPITNSYENVIKLFCDEDNVKEKDIKNIFKMLFDSNIYFLKLPNNLAGFTTYSKDIYLTTRLIEPFYEKHEYEKKEKKIGKKLRQKCMTAIFALESCIWHEYAHIIVREYTLIKNKECGAFFLTEPKIYNNKRKEDESGSFFDYLLLPSGFDGKYTFPLAYMYIYKILDKEEILLDSKEYYEFWKFINDPKIEKTETVVPCNKKIRKDKLTDTIFPGFCFKKLAIDNQKKTIY